MSDSTGHRSTSPGAGRRGGILLSLIGAATGGIVVTWWITVAQRVRVRSDADLSSVPFGFPLPWVSQDHSSNPFASYPNDVALRLTGRGGIPYPTEYAWAPFLVDALIWSAVLWLAGMLALPAVIRMLRARSGRAAASGRSPRNLPDPADLPDAASD